MMYRFKRGDSFPFIGRIAITNESGEDITALEDFTLWSFSCQYKDALTPDANVVYTVPTPLVGTGPLFDCSLPSSVSATLEVGRKYYVDFRLRDPNGTVRSTATRTLVFDERVSVTP